MNITTVRQKIRYAVWSLLLSVCSLTVLAGNRGPDAGGYTATDATVYSFVDISSGGGAASVLAGTDDSTAALTLPFGFLFYGQTYTMACVSSNGALYFIASVGACDGFESDFANTDLTVAGPPNDRPAVLPFWSDLTFQIPGSGAVFYQTLGSPGSRRFVVQWQNVFPQGSPNPVTFQAILFEGSGNILIQYQTIGLWPGNSANSGKLATVGIRNSGGLASGRQIQWSYDAAVLADGQALLFTACTLVIQAVTATPNILQPPNKNMVPVAVTTAVSDACGGVSCKIISVSSNEPVDSGGDWVITGNLSLNLTADRLGKGSGRIYTIVVQCTDASGNRSTKTVTVTVPHDQGN